MRDVLSSQLCGLATEQTEQRRRSAQETPQQLGQAKGGSEPQSAVSGPIFHLFVLENMGMGNGCCVKWLKYFLGWLQIIPVVHVTWRLVPQRDWARQ